MEYRYVLGQARRRVAAPVRPGGEADAACRCVAAPVRPGGEAGSACRCVAAPVRPGGEAGSAYQYAAAQLRLDVACLYVALANLWAHDQREAGDRHYVAC